MANRQSSILGKIWYVIWRLLLLYVVVLLVFRFVPVPTSAFMLQSDYPVTQKWISIDKLPPAMPLAVVASEDQRFPVHFGVDFTEIINALEQYDDGEGLRGASTISQQTAKNLFLWSGRSFIRKGVEAALATSLEIIWGKISLYVICIQRVVKCSFSLIYNWSVLSNISWFHACFAQESIRNGFWSWISVVAKSVSSLLLLCCLLAWLVIAKCLH